MQIKSWQIALMSLPFGTLGAINETYRYLDLAEKYNFSINPIETFITTLIGYTIYLGLPILFLYIEKTRKIGAIACIFMGIWWIVMAAGAVFVLGRIGLEAIAGLTLLIAGIYHFWKKV